MTKSKGAATIKPVSSMILTRFTKGEEKSYVANNAHVLPTKDYGQNPCNPTWRPLQLDQHLFLTVQLIKFHCTSKNTMYLFYKPWKQSLSVEVYVNNLNIFYFQMLKSKFLWICGLIINRGPPLGDCRDEL